MSRRVICSVGVLILLAAAAGAVSSVAAVGSPKDASGEPLSQCNNGKPSGFELESTIAFSSTRDDPTGVPVADAAEIYLMNPDGTNPRRLTDNTAGDGFPNLSPDGKKIVFDSDRFSGHINNTDLFSMNADGSEQTFLTHGSSATWSPDCKTIAFHASASGTGTPTRTDPGSATTDSDIFVANVEDLAAGVAVPRNITNSPDKIDDDADWSPDGQSIVYTAHDVGDDPPAPPFISNTAEIYVISADGTGTPSRLTDNTYEERAPAWSPDGSAIVFSCRTGGGTTVFHICIKEVGAPATDPPQQLTSSPFGDLTPTWSPDGSQILFHRNKPAAQGGPQLWVMNADGTGQTQLTFPPGINLLAHWGELRVHEKSW
jgi:TolB protein